MKEKHKYLLFAVLVFYSLAVVLQGVDFCDAGWQLTAYQQILSHPAHVNYFFMYWLTGILGHFWQGIFQEGGLLWSRIGAVLFFILTLIIYDYLLKSFSGKNHRIILLLPVYLFVYGSGPEVLNYDVFTQLFYGLFLIFFITGLVKRNNLLLFFAGMVLGANLFIKFSNLSGLLFLALLPWFAKIQKNPVKWIESGLITGAGLLSAIITLFIVMKLLGHIPYYLRNLAFLKQMSGANEASHNIRALLSSYGIGYVKMAIISIPLLFLMFFTARFTRSLNINKVFSFMFTGVVILALAWISIRLGNPFWSKVRYFFLGSMYITGLVILWDHKSSNELKLITMSGIILLFIAPLGSDSDLEKMSWGAWILGPLFLQKTGSEFSLPFLRQTHFLGSKRLYRLMMLVLVITFIGYSWNNTYNDPGSRVHKTVAAKVPKLKHIYTTPERAACIAELSTTLQGFVHQGDPLLAFIDIPMIHYITGTTPYLSTSWPKLLYSPEIFREEIYDTANKSGLPVVVRQTANIAHTAWPADGIPDYTKYIAPGIAYPEYGKIINRFFSDFKYTLIWHNRIFEIWIPDKN